MVKNLSLFFIAFSILMLSSCASMIESPVLSVDYVPTDDNGYIYGRFDLVPPEEELLMIYFGASKMSGNDFYFGEDPTIGIIVENLDTETQLSFRLEAEEDAIQMLAIPPGNYRIVLLEYLCYEIGPELVEFDMEGYQNDFVVEANTAVYIGDFSGSVGRDYNNILHWSLKPVANNYDETAYDLFRKYPFLRVSGIADVSHMK